MTPDSLPEKGKERVAIVGSREWSEPLAILGHIFDLPQSATIISGGARGVDRFAEQCARERGMKVVIHEADWETHGKRAGFIRNEKIVADCDRMIAFWDGKSPGTKMTIDLARKAGKRVDVIAPAKALSTPTQEEG